VKNIKVIFILLIGWYLFDACSTNPYKSGEVLYKNFCSSCHGVEGEGFGDLYPPIAGSDYLKNHAGDLTCMIRNGMWDTITVNGKVYSEPMPEIPQLDDVAITNINNFINYKWPYREEMVTITEVREELQSCE